MGRDGASSHDVTGQFPADEIREGRAPTRAEPPAEPPAVETDETGAEETAPASD